jgi:hypothetical protein
MTLRALNEDVCCLLRLPSVVGEANVRGFGNSSLLSWESANDCNPTLLWHQPWVIVLAELHYSAATTNAERAGTLKRLSPLVFATADFLSSFAERRADVGGTRGMYYDLAPPLTDAAEDQGPAANAHNPTLELTQTRYALATAILWRQRLGLTPEPSWAQVLRELVRRPLRPATCCFDWCFPMRRLFLSGYIEGATDAGRHQRPRPSSCSVASTKPSTTGISLACPPCLRPRPRAARLATITWRCWAPMACSRGSALASMLLS